MMNKTGITIFCVVVSLYYYYYLYDTVPVCGRERERWGGGERERIGGEGRRTEEEGAGWGGLRYT